MIERLCKSCHKNMKAYSTIQNKCPDCLKKTYKPIPKRGKATKVYEVWRDKIAIPYLTNRFGYVCSMQGCMVSSNLDVDHIQKRGSHPGLKMDVHNVRFLCRQHHRKITDQIKWSNSDGYKNN